MREQYGVLFPRFWEGTTGRQLQEKGRDAVILAAYLASCRHANMIGLYELPLVFLERELTVLKSRQIVLQAFDAIQHVSYATYDLGTEHVWVREMARIRLGLEPGETISANDKKHKAVLKLYEAAKPNPFLAPFFDRYTDTLRLTKPRIGPPLVPVLQGASKGLARGSKGATKPVQVQKHQQVQVQGSETSAGTTTESAAAAPRRERPVENSAENVEVITAIVIKEVLPLLGVKASRSDITETTKQLCAKNGIAYGGDVVGRAIDSALHRAKLRKHA